MKYTIRSSRCIAVAMLTCLGLAACNHDAEDEAPDSPGAPVAVTTAAVTRETLKPTLELSGVLEALPENTAVITSAIAGIVSEVPVLEGQRVEAGDAIAKLDTRLTEVEVDRAAAAAEEARANLSLLRKGARPEEIAAARDKQRSAAAVAHARQERLAALGGLRERGEISAIQYEQARSDFQEAEATRSSAAEELKIIESGARPEVLAQAEARLQGAEADLESTRLKMSLCAIVSPIPGTITQLSARRGMSVDANTTLAHIADTSTLLARLRAPFAAVASLSNGGTASVTVAGESTARTGSVMRMGAAADPQTGGIEIFVQIQNGDGVLRPGLPCQAAVDLAEVPDAVAVPEKAVAELNGVATVTLIKDGKSLQQQVKTGAHTGELVQITEGLSPGETVIIEGGYALPDGTAVQTTAP